MGDKGEWKSASWKQEEDHSKETDEILKRINADEIAVLLRSTAKTLEQYLEDLLVLEKKCRFGGDTLSTQRLAVEVIRICRTQKNYPLMLTQLEALLKKRGQMKQVQSAMIKEAGLSVGEAEKPLQKIDLLTQLRFLTQGKIHVELEHARFSTQLADLIVAEGRAKEASDMLAQVQVETITNMPRVEKIECILKQLRLALDLKDANRTTQLSRKLNPRALGKKDSEPLKIRYFRLMLEHYDRCENAYLLMARCWHEIYLTLPEYASEANNSSAATAAAAQKPSSSGAAADADAAPKDMEEVLKNRLDALEHCIVFALLASFQTQREVDDLAEFTAFSKQSSQVDREKWLKELLAENKDVRTDLPKMERLLSAFTSVELIRMSHGEEIERLCATHPALAGNAKRLGDFLFRLSEHDIMVAARYYNRIKLQRLAELVGLSLEQTEGFVMTMVQTKTVYAKIDRIDGIVVFQKPRVPVDVVAEWNKGVENVATLVERTAQLVDKERMLLHNTTQASAVAAN